MIYHQLSSYLEAKNEFESIRGVIKEGKGFYDVDGELIPDEIFFQHNSKPRYEKLPLENPDKRHVPNA